MRAWSWMLLALCLPLLAGVLLLALALEPQPLVSRAASLSPASVADARRLVAVNDPSRLRSGEERRVSIPARLIDDAVNHLASRSWRARAAFVLAEARGEFRLTVKVPLLPRFLNLSATVAEADGGPQIASASLGSFKLPATLVEFGIAVLARQAGHVEDLVLARTAIRKLAFEPRRASVVVTYVWDPELLDRARTIALGEVDVARIAAAHSALVALLERDAPGSTRPLTTVLAAMLKAAGGEAAAHRRAALLVMAAYLGEKSLAPLIPESRKWPRPRPQVLTLQGREDLAQHFVVSAALALWAGEPVAEVIGLAKEIDDSRGGSGFSFADLAADRSGTRFGEIVLRDPQRIDALLARSLSDADLLPAVDGLPEHLAERDLRKAYGGVDAPAYRKVLAEIDSRIAARPLYR